MSYQIEALVSLTEDMGPVPSINMGQKNNYPDKQTNQQKHPNQTNTTTANTLTYTQRI